jgi:HTH-type transcriptional regulator/antitoxin HipB
MPSMSDLARSPRQIGNLIRRQRKKLGLSQAQLGEQVGLRQATVSLIETGNPAARIDTLLALLATLDLEFRIAPRSRQALREQDIEGLIG